MVRKIICALDISYKKMPKRVSAGWNERLPVSSSKSHEEIRDPSKGKCICNYKETSIVVIMTCDFNFCFLHDLRD
jgi:hypothetical protein